MPLNPKCGIIVGCNEAHEKLLPWWWYHYSAHNSYPVTFVDFGMSAKAKNWCRQRGAYILLQESFSIALKEDVSPERAALWEGLYSPHFWPSRTGWFKKPLALRVSPYAQAIWIDLDCEVRGCVAPLFEYCDNPSGIALAREPDVVQKAEQEHGILVPGEISYNSGVVVFKQDSAIVRQWAQKSISDNALFVGDQQVLSRLLFEQKAIFNEFSSVYNYNMSFCTDKLETVINHWVGGPGKRNISRQIEALSQIPCFDFQI